MLNLDTSGLTPTQYKILQVLSDGKDHLKKELVACLPDPLSTDISPHLADIRRVLRLQGQDVRCVLMQRRTGYCWIQLCPPAYQAWAYHHADKVKQALANIEKVPASTQAIP